MCVLVLLSLLSGCAPADDAAYHEMTQQDLAKLQAEEAGSTSPPESTSKQQPEQQESPEPEKTETATITNQPDEKTAPAPKSPNKMQSEKTGITTAANNPKDNPNNGNEEKPGGSRNIAAMASEKNGTALIAKNSLNSNTSRPSPLQPGLMRPRGTLPGDLPGKIEKRDPKLLIPEKKFRKEGKQGAIRVSFDDIDLLKVLNMEPVPEDATKMFPDWLSGLDGKRVRIRGFMFPTMSQKGITYFQFVRDNEICCFGRTPKIYDRISTVLKKGEATDYIQGRPFDVIGTLRIDPIYIDGEWLQLYLLEDAIVIDNK